METRITTKMKAFYFGALCIASLSLTFYACSAGQSDWEQDMENELELKTAMSRSLKLDSRLDSVMYSEEFLDLIVAYQTLNSKMDSFFENLTEAEMKKMDETAALINVEDDRCMEEVNKFYNFSKDEIVAYSDAMRRLYKNTSYSKLTDKERASLFESAVLSIKNPSMKSRSEGGDRCAEYRRLAAKAEEDFYWNMENCLKAYGPTEDNPNYDPEYARCMFNAKKTYDDRIKWLDEEYSDCMSAKYLI